jgi:hypothetical protein
LSYRACRERNSSQIRNLSLSISNLGHVGEDSVIPEGGGEDFSSLIETIGSWIGGFIVGVYHFNVFS